MPMFRSKVVEIEAFQLPGMNESLRDFINWAANVGLPLPAILEDGSLPIETLEGTMRASPGDWIIKGLRGEFYPCKQDVFEQRYELVE